MCPHYFLPRAATPASAQPELSALLSYCGPPSGAGGPTPVSGPSSISGGSAVVRRPQTAAAAALLSPGGAVSALLTSGFLSRGLQQDSAALWFSFPRGVRLPTPSHRITESLNHRITISILRLNLSG